MCKFWGKSIFIKIIIVLIIVFKSVACVAEEENLLRKIDKIRSPGKDFSFDLEIIIKGKDEQRVYKYNVFIKDEIKSLVKFIYPSSEKGKIILMVGQDMWMYFPTSQKPIRITPQQRLIGDVSNADIARIVYSLDYEIANINKDKVDNLEMYKIELKPKSKSASYGKILLWTEIDSSKPYKAQCYSMFDKLLKTAYYKDYEEVLEKLRPMELEIHSEISKNSISIMKYSNFNLNSLPESYYQKDYLKYIK